jgi:5'(3')-deoxyribonucleotidase
LNIFVDMDDVVADWMAYARSIVNRDWNYGQRIPDTDWNQLKAQQRFYRDLPLKPGAESLVHWCREYSKKTHCGLFFLTALPHDYSMPYAAQDKVWWAHEYFPDIPVFFGPFSHDKWRHCQPGDVLIDDRQSNCSEWRSAGGLAHEYRSWDQCEIWLKEMLK